MPKITNLNYVPTRQAAASLNQAAPVQNTWYTVLDTTKNVEIINIAFNVQTANEDLEVKLTFDGISETISQAAVAGTNYFIDPVISANTSTLNFVSGTSFFYERPFLAKFQSLKVEIRKTSATGAGNLRSVVQYCKW